MRLLTASTLLFLSEYDIGMVLYKTVVWRRCSSYWRISWMHKCSCHWFLQILWDFKKWLWKDQPFLLNVECIYTKSNLCKNKQNTRKKYPGSSKDSFFYGFCLFCGKIENSKNCSQDLLTFSSSNFCSGIAFSLRSWQSQQKGGNEQ